MAIVPIDLARADSLTDDPRVKSSLDLIEVWVETQIAYEVIPGVSMGIVYDQDLIWSKGFGYANPDEGIEASPTTIYSICSISKLFTSVAVMQLRDEGKLSLDDPIEKYLPWYQIKDKYPEAPPVALRARDPGGQYAERNAAGPLARCRLGNDTRSRLLHLQARGHDIRRP
jgi:CubicO group peptidase (beta-lactamase class C family)